MFFINILAEVDARVCSSVFFACSECATHTRQLVPGLNRAENKAQSSASASASAAARADTHTKKTPYVLLRSRAVKGAFHEGTKRRGERRSARHYHSFLPGPFKRWVISFPDVLPTFLEEVNKRTTCTCSIIFRGPACDVRARPSGDVRVVNVTRNKGLVRRSKLQNSLHVAKSDHSNLKCYLQHIKMGIVV